MIIIKKTERKNYHTYGKEEAIQDLIANVNEDGVSNEAYEKYAELMGWLKPNRRSKKKQKQYKE